MICGLQQHQKKKHENIPEQETLLGKVRLLKRKRDEAEEEQQRRNVAARLALEATVIEPELHPVRLRCFTHKA